MYNEEQIKKDLFEYIKGCFKLNGRSDLASRVVLLDKDLSKIVGCDIVYVNYDESEYLVKVVTYDNSYNKQISLPNNVLLSQRKINKDQKYLVCVVTLDEENRYRYEYLKFDQNQNLESCMNKDKFERVLK